MICMQSVTAICPTCGDLLSVPVEVGKPVVDLAAPHTARIDVRADVGGLRAHVGSHVRREIWTTGVTHPDMVAAMQAQIAGEIA